MRKPGLWFHHYADDLQLCVTFKRNTRAVGCSFTAGSQLIVTEAYMYVADIMEHGSRLPARVLSMHNQHRTSILAGTELSKSTHPPGAYM